MNTPLIDIHTHRTAPQGVLSVYAYDALGGDPLPQIPYSTGIHPWTAQSLGDEKRPCDTFLGSITPLTVAIGEIGLDYHTARDEPSRQRQQMWLRRQLEVAAQQNLPVIIHCVKAYNPLIDILRDYPVPCVIHGFTGSAQLAGQLLDAGCSLSFGASLLRSPKTREALRITPPDRIFLETDTQHTWPIETLYAQVARQRELTPERLQEILYDNYKRLFNR